MQAPDPRTNAYRSDLADARLRGRISASRFVSGSPGKIVSPTAPVRIRPSRDAEMVSELLLGEAVLVFETTSDGWCWSQSVSDDYVGWVPAGSVAARSDRACTHRVAVLRTLAFASPEIKRSPKYALSFGARLSVVGEAERGAMRFAVSDEGANVPLQHLVEIGCHAADFVAEAERFLGTPYLWGGRSSLGLDCSGLLQIALQASGYYCPRDSDMQAQLGSEIAPREPHRRGDLVFWPGHVGIMQGPETLLHASAFHMAVVSEPVADTVARLADTGLMVCSRRRTAREPE